MIQVEQPRALSSLLERNDAALSQDDHLPDHESCFQPPSPEVYDDHPSPAYNYAEPDNQVSIHSILRNKRDDV